MRDGLSAKTDFSGKRLHLRKCQCREKTPPCRNCPKCKEVPDIMNINEPAKQFQACQLRLQCEICACKYVMSSKFLSSPHWTLVMFPGARALASGWRPTPTAEAHTHTAWRCGSGSKSSRRPLQSATAREASNGFSCPTYAHVCVCLQCAWTPSPQGTGAASWSPLIHATVPVRLAPPNDPTSDSARENNATAPIPLGSLTVNSNGPSSTVVDILHCSKCIAEHANHQPHAQPASTPLPEPVAQLVHEVIERAAGPGPASAVTAFLQAQCVTGLEDLKYIELAWMREALEPQGVPLMLLNKLLKKWDATQ